VRVPIAFEVVIEVGVGVEVEDLERSVVPVKRTHHRITQGVVAAQQERSEAALEQFGDRGLDGQTAGGGILGQRQISLIDPRAWCTGIDAPFTPFIAVVAAVRCPDGGRRAGRPSSPRRGPIPRQPQHRDSA
jgi:hypothetical protein